MKVIIDRNQVIEEKYLQLQLKDNNGKGKEDERIEKILIELRNNLNE